MLSLSRKRRANHMSILEKLMSRATVPADQTERIEDIFLITGAGDCAQSRLITANKAQDLMSQYIGAEKLLSDRA